MLLFGNDKHDFMFPVVLPPDHPFVKLIFRGHKDFVTCYLFVI